MGKPLPGVEARIVKHGKQGIEVIDERDVEGELALRAGWPSMFRAYLGQDERYRKFFAGDLYLSGDLARRDADGYFWFVGRAVAAAHTQRKDHSPAAQGARAGAARKRHVDPGGGRVNDIAKSHSRELLHALVRDMVRIRRFEEKCAELYGAGKIRGFLHLYIGEEAVAAGALCALSPEDAVVATYREHGHALVRGVPANAIMAEMFGKASGCSRGRGGSMHLFDVAKRLYGGNAIVGGGLPIAAGLALADKMQNRSRGMEKTRPDSQLHRTPSRGYNVCDEHRDIATASLIEVWIDETERRTWFCSRQAARAALPDTDMADQEKDASVLALIQSCASL